MEKRNTAKDLTKNSIQLRFVKKTSKPNSIKGLGYLKCYSLISPRTIKKALVILSDTTVRRSTVDREDLKPYWKSEKKIAFL